MIGLRRRKFITGGAAMALGAGTMSFARADPLGLPIGLQLYTVQDAIQRDFDGTLRKVAAIGYRAVETGLALGGRSARDLRMIFESLGLDWKSAHINGAELQGGLQETIDQAHEAGLNFLVCAFPLALRRSAPATLNNAAGYVMDIVRNFTLDDWKANADFFNRVGEQIKKAGLQFAYHNHNLEFRKFGDATGYDTLLARTDPALVKLELDCGWMVSAGRDPADYLTRYSDRYVMLHVKDLKQAPPNTELKMKGADLGTGIIDWPRLFAAAGKAKIAAAYVEQEPPYPQSSLQSVQADFDYLHNLKLS
ncbi:MAG TPA: sugar phosphate isomerase/epimerase [Alphaproteobacteria bacterium]|nr:sugar phosphate isomerase/epimerase [Alphaproteobacteria bacterium]